MRRILIVDDQPAMLSALEMALQPEFEVCAVMSAEEGLSIVSAFQPAVVLTDYKMHGYNGLDLIRKILLLCPQQPKVVLFSSAMDHVLRRQAEELGVSACFSKPFDLEQLKTTLHALVDAQQP